MNFRVTEPNRIENNHFPILHLSKHMIGVSKFWLIIQVKLLWSLSMAHFLLQVVAIFVTFPQQEVQITLGRHQTSYSLFFENPSNPSTCLQPHHHQTGKLSLNQNHLNKTIITLHHSWQRNSKVPVLPFWGSPRHKLTIKMCK